MKSGYLRIGLLCAIINTLTLHAAQTRIDNLGYLANFYVRDNYNIWGFPSTIVNYPDRVFFESLSGDGLWSGGGNLKVSSVITLGMYFRDHERQIAYADPGIELDGLDFFINDDAAMHQFDVFAGFDMNNVDLGFHISTFSSTAFYNDPSIANFTIENKLSSYDVEGGISFKAGDRSRIDAAVMYSTSDFYFTYMGGRTRAPEEYSSYAVGGRMFYAHSPRVVIVPFLGYMQGNEGYRLLIDGMNGESGIRSLVDRHSQYIVGVALDIMPFRKNLVTFASGVVSSSMTRDATYANELYILADDQSSYVAFPFFSLGVESWLTKWLGVRVSAYELLEKYTDKEGITPRLLTNTEMTGSSYGARLGLAFKLGQFEIDTIVDTNGSADFLHNPAYLLSGDHSGTLFSQVSLTYHFNEDKTGKSSE